MFMLKNDFENLTMKKFDDEQFAIIENVFFPTISEDGAQAFCEAVEDDKDGLFSTALLALTNKAHELIDDSVNRESKSCAKAALALIGEKAFLKYKLVNGLTLFQRDKDRILELAGDKLADILG